jgi:hypothetical protein
MSGTASGTTARPDGVQRVCRTWEQPRSSYYAQRQAALLPLQVGPLGKRGPQRARSDDQILELMQADLATSPFQGHGQRKVWARLWGRGGGQTLCGPLQPEAAGGKNRLPKPLAGQGGRLTRVAIRRAAS